MYEQKIDNIVKSIFFFSTVLLFIGIGLDRFTAPFFIISSVSALWLLGRIFTVNNILSLVPFSSWIPIFFILYCFISPGNFFKDAPVAEKIFYSYLIGLISVIFFEKKYWYFFLALGMTIVCSFILYILMTPEWMSHKGQLILFFHHPSVLGAVSGWCILFFIAYHNTTFSGYYRYYICITCSNLLISLILSVGRSAYLGFGLACIFLCIMLFQKHILKIGVIAIFLGMLAYMVLPTQQQERVFSMFHEPLEDPTFKSRLPIWIVAHSGFIDSPWVGNSARGFREYHKAYILDHRTELYKKYPNTESTISHPHSLFLGIPSAYGIAGTILYIACFAPAVLLSWRKKDVFFLGVVVFYLGYGLFEYSLHRKEGIFMLFFPLGLVYGREIAASLQRQLPAQHGQPCGAQAK